MKYFLSFIFIFGCIDAMAQSDDYLYGFFSDMQIGAKSGISQLITEYSKNGAINEFRSQPGFNSGIEISKQLSARWESGIEFNETILRGETDAPDFSAFGNHPIFEEPITGHVVYRNRLLDSRIFVQFNCFRGKKDCRFLSFVRAGVGLLDYKSEMRYKEESGGNFIFGKGIGPYKEDDMSTAIYYFTPGIRFSLKENVKLMASVNFNMVNYDFLDVVHNYDASGERLSVIGIYSDFIVGISVFFNNTGRYNANGIRQKQKQQLPFYQPR